MKLHDLDNLLATRGKPMKERSDKSRGTNMKNLRTINWEHSLRNSALRRETLFLLLLLGKRWIGAFKGR